MGYRIMLKSKSGKYSDGYARMGSGGTDAPGSYGRPGGVLKFKTKEAAQKYARSYRGGTFKAKIEKISMKKATRRPRSRGLLGGGWW